MTTDFAKTKEQAIKIARWICYKTFYYSNLLQLRGNNFSLWYKTSLPF
jgi:hypothetical protein